MKNFLTNYYGVKNILDYIEFRVRMTSFNATPTELPEKKIITLAVQLKFGFLLSYRGREENI